MGLARIRFSIRHVPGLTTVVFSKVDPRLQSRQAFHIFPANSVRGQCLAQTAIIHSILGKAERTG